MTSAILDASPIMKNLDVKAESAQVRLNCPIRLHLGLTFTPSAPSQELHLTSKPGGLLALAWAVSDLFLNWCLALHGWLWSWCVDRSHCHPLLLYLPWQELSLVTGLSLPFVPPGTPSLPAALLLLLLGTGSHKYNTALVGFSAEDFKWIDLWTVWEWRIQAVVLEHSTCSSVSHTSPKGDIGLLICIFGLAQAGLPFQWDGI